MGTFALNEVEFEREVFERVLRERRIKDRNSKLLLLRSSRQPRQRVALLGILIAEGQPIRCTGQRPPCSCYDTMTIQVVSKPFR